MERIRTLSRPHGRPRVRSGKSCTNYTASKTIIILHCILIPATFGCWIWTSCFHWIDSFTWIDCYLAVYCGTTRAVSFLSRLRAVSSRSTQISWAALSAVIVSCSPSHKATWGPFQYKVKNSVFLGTWITDGSRPSSGTVMTVKSYIFFLISLWLWKISNTFLLMR